MLSPNSPAHLSAVRVRACWSQPFTAAIARTSLQSISPVLPDQSRPDVLLALWGLPDRARFRDEGLLASLVSDASLMLSSTVASSPSMGRVCLVREDLDEALDEALEEALEEALDVVPMNSASEVKSL